MNDVERAAALVDAGQYAAAVEHAQRAVAATPDDALPRLVLVVALLKAGRAREGVEVAVSALAIAPDDPDIHHNLACGLLDLGRYRPAEQHFSACLELQPERADTHAMLARTLALLGNYQPATEHAERAIALEPQSPLVHSKAGDVAADFQQWKTAEEHYRRALALDPEDTFAHTNLGYVLTCQGRSAEALKHSVNAARLEPSNRVARANVVHLGRGTVIGGGALFTVGQIVARFPELFGWWGVALSVIAPSAVVVYYRAEQHLLMSTLEPVVRDALEAERRVEGLAPPRLWIMAGWAAAASAGTAATVALTEITRRTAALQFMIASLMVAAVCAAMVLRKVHHYDPRTDVGRQFPAWAALTTLAAAGVGAGFMRLAGLLGGRAADGWTLIGMVAPVMAVGGYIAAAKRPLRLGIPKGSASRATTEGG